jgi:hypothetical protein
MTLLSIHLDAILREALASPLGLTVEIESALPIANRTQVAKQQFFNLTRDNAEFRTLWIGLSPDFPDTELWIIHKSALEIEISDSDQ